MDSEEFVSVVLALKAETDRTGFVLSNQSNAGMKQSLLNEVSC